MNKIYIVDGVQYNVAPNREEEFLKKFPTATLQEQEVQVEKPEPVAEITAPAAGQRPDMGSQLESGSSELRSEEEEDEPNVLQSLIARTGRGVVTAVKGLSSFKDGLIFGAMNLYDPDKSTEEKKALYDAIERGSATDMLPSTDDFEAAEEWLSKYVRRTDNESITDAIANGDYAEAAEMTVGGALESVPSVLAALTGYGGIALFGASVAGNKFDEELEKNPEEAVGTLALNALGSGATEAGFELVTRGILSKAGFINKEMGAKAAKEFLNQSAGSMAKKLGLGYLGEAGSEAATELTQTINDAYGFLGTGVGELEGRADETLAKTVGNNIKNIVDAGIVGGFMGGTISTVGALGNNTAARNRAEQILTPEIQKEQMETSAKNISEYVKDLEKTEDEYERSLLEKKILEEENNIVKTKKKVSLGLSSLKGDNLSKYAKNQDEITKAKASIESDTDAEKAKSLARQRYDELVNENNEILESSIKQKFEDITESAEKQAGDLGVEFKRFKTSKEVEDYILSKDKRKTKKSKVLAESNDGFIIQNFDGTQEIIINEEVAMDPENQAVNVASHELLHGVLYNTLKGNPDTAENLGIELGKEIAKINVEEVADSNFRKRLELYADESTAVQGEEVLALFSDAVATGDIKYNENIFTKLGDGVRRVLETVGLKKKFNTGRDVYNFIKDYNADIAKGGLRQSIIQGAKEGFEGKLVKDAEKQAKSVIKESRSNLKGLLDKYGDKKTLIEQSLLKTPQGQETFDFVKSEFGQEVAPIVESVTKRLYDPIPQDAKQGVSREDYKNAMISDLATIVDREYDPAKQDLDKFVGIRAFQRSNRLAKQLGIESVVERGGAGITTDVTEAKAITAEEKAPDEVSTKKPIAEALKLPKEISEKTNRLAELAAIKADKSLEGKETSDVKKLSARNKAFNDIFSKQLFNDIKTELGKNTKNSNNFSKYLDKNYEGLLDAALANIDFQKGGGVSVDWNTNPPTKQEFVDYYEATNEKASTRADRKKSLNNAIARQLANEARIEFAKKDSATAELFKKKHGVVLASKSLIPSNEKLQTLSGIPNFNELGGMPARNVWKGLNAETNIGFNLSTESGRKKAISSMKKALIKGRVPIDAFSTAEIIINSSPRFFVEQEKAYTNAKAKFGKNNKQTIAADKERMRVKNEFVKNMNTMLSEVKNSGKAVYLTGSAKGWTKNKYSFNTLGKNLTQIAESFKNGKVAKNNLANLSMFEQTMRPLYNLISDAKTASEKTEMVNLIMMLTNTSNGGSNLWFRQGAEVVGFSKFLLPGKEGKRGIEWEHAMQANNARLFLLNSALNNVPWATVYPAVKRNYKVIALDKSLDDILKSAKRGNAMGEGWNVYTSHWTERYFHPDVVVFGGIDPSSIIDISGQPMSEKYNIDSAGQPIATERILASKSVDPVKKIRVFDFDDTLAKSNSQVKYTLPDGTTGSLNATEYAKRDQELKDKGAKFDFSEFSKVIDGKKGPLFNVAKKIANARGNEDLFVLTARPADAADAIQKFLSLAGINFKKENIVGLGDGTAKAKSDWILGKTKEGYNDFYFADDAIKNVVAVKEALKTVDVKSKTQRVLASKNLSDDFNNLLERVKGVAADATYSEARAIKLGKKNNPFKFFVPYSAEDYMGLVYPTLGKGKEGDKNLKWYKENITDVYARGIRDFEIAKQQSMTQWTELKKQIKNSPAKLGNDAVRDFSNEEAIRLYLWDQQGMLPDNVAKKDIEAINKYINSKPELKSFVEQIQVLTLDGYPAPTGDWLAGTITTDLVNYTNTASREQYLSQWQENVDAVYSKDNMNKLRAIYGEDYTEALNDMLYRMKTGRNRPSGANKLTNQFMNWVNDSVGTIMFFNTRSALLQTISAVNYLNFTDNNPLRVAAAFANQKQYWSDFSEIFNSDFLKQRRGGLKTDVNADEIARAASTSDNKVRAALAAILKKGFLPTQLADSFAISVGGAAFYRNRINSLMKDGLTEEQAKEQAFLDFKETTEESQQSSRPDRVSMQQASPLGRVVLAFANTPMQYTRLTKKAALDLFNGRGDWKTNLSKLAYYGAVQNIIFTALQSAMFAMLFSDEEDDKEKEKIGRIGNGIADTLLRGSGVYGAGVAMIKNIVMEAIKQYNSGRPDYTKAAAKITSISPPVDSKIRKLQSVGRTFTYKQEIEKMRTRGFDIDNPAYMAVGQTVSALANIPLDRAVRKMNNLKTAVDQDTELWQSIGLALGYSEWDLGMIQAQQKKDREQKKADKVKKAYMKKFSPKLDAKTKRIISFSKMSKEEKKEYIQKRAKAGQPLFKKDFSNSLPKGVLGRANKDGTIEVANGLSPTKKKQVIAHEKKHQEDMKSGKLNYDKNFIYWNNEKYKRTSDKKINYKGKLYIEGSPALPWEKAANNAEKQIN